MRTLSKVNGKWDPHYEGLVIFLYINLLLINYHLRIWHTDNFFLMGNQFISKSSHVRCNLL